MKMDSMNPFQIDFVSRGEPMDNCIEKNFEDLGNKSPISQVSIDEDTQYGVDLSEKGTNLTGKSFTIAAILGLRNQDENGMNLSVDRMDERMQYFYGRDSGRGGFCHNILSMGYRPDNSSTERNHREQSKGRTHSVSCSSSGRSKRIRTIFTPEQLERLEAEFERQQYMVGPERLYLAHALQLTEAQVKVWFQNRRIKWRKHHLEVTQQRLAVLQRHRMDEDV